MAYCSGKAAWLAVAFAMAAAAFTPCAAQDTQQDVLNLHNAARKDVGVGPVSWDDTVAAYAQSYATQRQGDCALKLSGGGPNAYGENLFSGPAGKNWTASDAVNAWVAEKQYYDHSNNSCAAGQECLSYTQVVWSNTTAVGCAGVVCNNGGVFITCNYNPAGNVPGESPY